MNSLYPAVAERARYRCEYCLAPEQVFNFAFEVEHIQPRSAQGTDSLTNLALSCESCNLYKSRFTTGLDEETGQQTVLFHPRSQRWEDHFQLDTSTGEILGQTAIGRVTVQRLRFNSVFQLNARQLWIRLGLYP